MPGEPDKKSNRCVINPKMTREQRFKNKELKIHGKTYKGLAKDVHGKYKLTVERSARILGPTYLSTACKKSRVFFCSKFSDDDRKILFADFWSKFTWDMKCIYINSCLLTKEEK